MWNGRYALASCQGRLARRKTPRNQNSLYTIFEIRFINWRFPHLQMHTGLLARPWKQAGFLRPSLQNFWSSQTTPSSDSETSLAELIKALRKFAQKLSLWNKGQSCPINGNHWFLPQQIRFCFFWSRVAVKNKRTRRGQRVEKLRVCDK